MIKKMLISLNLIILIVLSANAVDLSYTVPKDQSSILIDDLEFFGARSFDEELDDPLSKARTFDGSSKFPNTYPYSVSNKKCNSKIPMLIHLNPFIDGISPKTGICVVYCNKDDNDHCYSEMYCDLQNLQEAWKSDDGYVPYIKCNEKKVLSE